MKRQKRKAQRTNKKSNPVATTATTAEAEATPTRRGFLKKARNGAIATFVVGTGGWFAIKDVCATMCEHDLSKIGNGLPAVVQIHDPQCPRCVALQREARDAMCELDSDKLQFLVANIRSEEGRKLAAAHGVGNVTLLLFDAKGRRRDIVAGPNESDYLTKVFQRHLARFGNS